MSRDRELSDDENLRDAGDGDPAGTDIEIALTRLAVGWEASTREMKLIRRDMAGIRTEMKGIETRLSEEIRNVRGKVHDAEGRIHGVEGRVHGVEGRVNEMEDSLDEHEPRRDATPTALTGSSPLTPIALVPVSTSPPVHATAVATPEKADEPVSTSPAGVTVPWKTVSKVIAAVGSAFFLWYGSRWVALHDVPSDARPSPPLLGPASPEKPSIPEKHGH